MLVQDVIDAWQIAEYAPTHHHAQNATTVSVFTIENLAKLAPPTAKNVPLQQYAQPAIQAPSPRSGPEMEGA